MRTCSQCQRTYPDDADFCLEDGTRLPPPSDVTEAALASSLARRFRIIRKLGAGGMGAVFLAEQIALGNRPVALKVLSRRLLDDPEFLERFHNEASSTARIRHPNVVTVYESGQSDDGAPYIAMEYLEGESLRHTLHTRGALPLAECALILQQAARGLNAAHRLGIVHRDLKPDNIFLTLGDEGEVVVKVVDFGLAKLRETSSHTLTGTVLGTPAYMSSEQAAGMRSDELDARSDIYSLGVVVYEMLMGRVPFHSDTPLGYIRKHVMDEPPPFRTVAPGLPVPLEVEATVMKALAKDRGVRYPSVLDFARDFGRAAAPTSADTPTPPFSTKRAEPFTPAHATDGLRGAPSVTPAASMARPHETAEGPPPDEFHGEVPAKTVRVEEELRTTLPPTPGSRAEPQKVLPQLSSPPPLAVQKKSSSRLLFASLATVVALVMVVLLLRVYWPSPPKQAYREATAPVGNNPPPNPPIPERNHTQIVVSDPSNAQVYLDDAFKGQVNSDERLVIEDPEAGEHNLKVTLAGWRDFDQQVNVTAGNVATVRAALRAIVKRPAPATIPRPLITSPARPAGINPDRRALTRDDITALLAGDTPSSDVVREIQSNGISFAPTADDESSIRAAGGTEELIQAIRKAAPHPQHGITKPQIFELLQGGVHSSRIASMVKDRGISFSPTTNDLNAIRSAGGDEGLIQAIQQAAANASRN